MVFARKTSFAKRAIGLAAAAALGVVLAAPSAPAQEGGGLGGFLQQLFGGQPQRPPPEPPKPKKKVRDFVPATTTREPGTPGGAAVQPTFFIDVLGDSLAVLAADGLTQAFADKPEIAIVDKSRDASGLVRADYFDWPKTAQELATGKDHIDFVVVMVGINDMQALRDGAETLDPLSDKWKVAYAARIDAVLTPFQAAHIPVAWVGLPPMRADRFNAQIVKLNEIDRAEVEKDGAKYIDIWDAFADQNGQYDAAGPNVDGQIVKLRGPDGIHFTKAGGRKVAHFLDAEIRRVFDKGRPQSESADLPPDIEQAAGDINAQIRREMGAPEELGAAPQLAPPKPLAGPILSLTGRPVSPGGALAVRESSPPGATDLVTRVLVQGEPADPRSGRADDFSWPRL